MLPIIKRVGNPGYEYRDIRNALKQYNKDLKEVAELSGITTTLTSYVSRHSWAMAAKRMNIPMEVISESLGHEDLKTTMVYLDSFDTDTLDAANDLVTG